MKVREETEKKKDTLVFEEIKIFHKDKKTIKNGNTQALKLKSYQPIMLSICLTDT